MHRWWPDRKFKVSFHHWFMHCVSHIRIHIHIDSLCIAECCLHSHVYQFLAHSLCFLTCAEENAQTWHIFVETYMHTKANIYKHSLFLFFSISLSISLALSDTCTYTSISIHIHMYVCMLYLHAHSLIHSLTLSLSHAYIHPYPYIYMCMYIIYYMCTF